MRTISFVDFIGLFFNEPLSYNIELQATRIINLYIHIICIR